VCRAKRCHSDPRATWRRDKKVDVIEYATDSAHGGSGHGIRDPQRQTRRLPASPLARRPSSAVFTRKTILLILPSLRMLAGQPPAQ